jgi:hypothetical protein
MKEVDTQLEVEEIGHDKLGESARIPMCGFGN